MLASIVDVSHHRLPAPVPARHGESSGVPIPGETALIAAAVLASQGKLQIELVIALAAAGAIVGDNIGYLIGRKGGRWLLERPGALPAPAPGGAARSASRSSNARPQGRVLRALRARPARVGVVAGRRHAHALALVRVLERARRHQLGDRDRPARLLPRPLRRQRDRSLRPLRPGAPCCWRSAARSSCTAATGADMAADRRRRPAATATRRARGAPTSRPRRGCALSSRCRARCAPTCPPARSARPRRSARRSAPSRPPDACRALPPTARARSSVRHA